MCGTGKLSMSWRDWWGRVLVSLNGRRKSLQNPHTQNVCGGHCETTSSEGAVDMVFSGRVTCEHLKGDIQNKWRRWVTPDLELVLFHPIYNSVLQFSYLSVSPLLLVDISNER